MHRIRSLLAFLVLLLALPAMAVADTYLETFDGPGTPARLTILPSSPGFNVSFTNGRAVFSQSGVGNGAIFLETDFTVSGDFLVTVQASFDNVAGNGEAGLAVSFGSLGFVDVFSLGTNGIDAQFYLPGIPLYGETFATFTPSVTLGVQRVGTTVSLLLDRGAGLQSLRSATNPLLLGPVVIDLFLIQETGSAHSHLASFDNLSISAVPEPMTSCLLMLGLVILGARIRHPAMRSTRADCVRRPVMTSTLRPCLLVLLLLTTGSTWAGDAFTDWSAATGLFPTAVSPPWSQSGCPQASIGGGALRIDGTAGDCLFQQSDSSLPLLDTASGLRIEIGARFVSGSHSVDNRDVLGIGVVQSGTFGTQLFIGDNRVFLTSGDGTRGATANVDTHGFHTYGLIVDAQVGLTASTVRVTYDGMALLTGSTFASDMANGSAQRILWGDGSIYASGVSEWQFVRSAVPEPVSVAMWIAGLLGVAGSTLRRSFTKPGVDG